MAVCCWIGCVDFLKIVVAIEVFLGRAARKGPGEPRNTGAALVMKTGDELDRIVRFGYGD